MATGARGAGQVLAIDIGGTKLAAGLVDRGGRLSAVIRTPTPSQPGGAELRPARFTGSGEAGEALWRTLLGLIDRVLGAGTVLGVGVGCGGPMTWPAGEVSPLNIPAWHGFPLRSRLQERFPGLPVRVHNDAICFTVGEHWRGAGRGRPNVLGMVVSTGVGGGLVLDGRVFQGASGNAGHIGHLVVDPAGPGCVCGGHGCLEAVARGPAVADWARAHGWSHPGGARELADDAARGHPAARAALARAGRALGVAVASATHLLDLDVVAIGGGLSQAGPLLFDPLEEAFRAHARMDFVRGVRVVPAALGQEAGLVGAAALVLAGDRYWAPLA